MSDTAYLSKDGYDRLKAELHDMKTVKRKEIAKAIAEAREKGDLSENAEYDAAREAQAHLELKISKMETTLANAKVVDEADVDQSKAYILSTVKVLNKKFNKEFVYTLVSAQEADLKAGKISVESPIGQALLGHAVGETVVAEVPAGQIELEILDISRS